MSILSLRKKRLELQLRGVVLALFRKCLRLTQKLEPAHQGTWYHYTKLKFRENAGVNDPKKIKLLLSEAEAEISFVEKILREKKQ